MHTTVDTANNLIDLCALDRAADHACRQIPPLWPLASSVAVNPFLGQSELTLAKTGARLAKVGGIPVTMPRSWYRQKIAANEITESDLVDAIAASSHADKPGSPSLLKDAVSKARPESKTLPTVAELASAESGLDWTGIIDDRFGAWAGGYFDRGQALWSAPRSKSAWAAWRAHASRDLTPEIAGLSGFAAFVAEAPDSPKAAIARAVKRLGLNHKMLDTYFHQILLSLGGWAHYARFKLWQAELADATDATLTDFLAIRLLWEEALLVQYEAVIGEDWWNTRDMHAHAVEPTADDIVDEILQEASERAAQRELSEKLSVPPVKATDDRPALQAAFCIDVRSEVFRRALETTDPSIRTLGFAGFFGVFAKHRRFASDVEELRLPVLLNPTVTSVSGDVTDKTDDLAARYAARAKRAWGRFKLAAVSSFAFVEAMGPVYIGKLLRDGLGFRRAATPNDPAPRFDPELDPDARIDAAETVLRAMSLTQGFARVVLLAGHGANVVNNPYESGLHCGACGGYSGEVNARLLASLLNEKEVRKGLKKRGIDVPKDTLFIGALHDTTTDAVTLYENDLGLHDPKADVKQIRLWLDAAGAAARGERMMRLPRAVNEADIARRAVDWAETRPEWALAGCKAFIAAPRSQTFGRNLAGETFLHDYDWHQDSTNGFGVLELIMTAPVVVASWISLQYYGSTVAPQTFGAGNKLLHNVVGGIGVVEGNGGRLRAGLPWQSVHDGERYVHHPQRLSVCIQAPREAMNDILERHENVRALFDNRWLHLFAMDEQGRLASRYTGNLGWEQMDNSARPSELDTAA
ncbi:MAG: DUF2309 domain-containing protein [Pseudomonadota bacterium]